MDLPGVLHLQTVPPLAGVTVQVDGQTARSDQQGRIAVPVLNFIDLAQRLVVPQTQVSPDRIVVFDRLRGNPDSGVRGDVIELGVRTLRLVSWRFLDRFGAVVPVSRVISMRLRNNTGEIVDLSGPALARPLWVSESRTQQGPNGLVSKQLYYVVDTAVVKGVSVVYRAQQRFVPWQQQKWTVQLLYYKVGFTSSDLLFGNHVGTSVELVMTDGSTKRLPFGKDGTVFIPNLPRGTYHVRVRGGGVSFTQPVSISKDQTVRLQVISVLDLTLIGGVVLVVAGGLILLGRSHLRPRWPGRWWVGPGRRLSRASAACWRALRRNSPQGGPGRPLTQRTGISKALVLAVTVTVAVASALAPARPATAKAGPTPVLAYYYIWFTPSSWNRAKTDYPQLGRYSSDDTEIMRQHVRMAKKAHIDGFLVSWKHTPQLDDRLAKLVAIAREESFHLGIVYEGLDFNRNPLPLTTVRSDLSLFAQKYANDPVFDIFGKPAVVWTGSDQFSSTQIDNTVKDLRSKILVLGCAKNVPESTAMQPAVDGEAYYWSSVDPTQTNTGTKLSAMAQVVHRNGGIWIAPVAPGFDARLTGGHKTVPRRDGETLRRSFEAAQSSDPDALGVISWNEFSENTYIEPSKQYGATAINTLANLAGAKVNFDPPTDSSDTTRSYWGLSAWEALLIIVVAAALLPAFIVIKRRRAAAVATGHLTADATQIEERT